MKNIRKAFSLPQLRKRSGYILYSNIFIPIRAIILKPDNDITIIQR